MEEKAHPHLIERQIFLSITPPGSGHAIRDERTAERGGVCFLKSVRALKGMPVILSDGGKKLGRVLKVSINEALDGLDGIWIAGRFGKARFCSREDIEMLGDVAVIVGKISDRAPRGQAFRIRRALDASGSLIGAVVGVYIDEETMKAECVDVSLGFWEDVAKGRQLVRRYAVIRDRGDVAVSLKGENCHEEELDSFDGCGRDDWRIGSDGIRHDELEGGAQDGAGGDECREGDCR